MKRSAILHISSSRKKNHGGTQMVEVSEMAREKLLEHLKNTETSMAVRVTVTAG
jgi:hypothetical protein